MSGRFACVGLSIVLMGALLCVSPPGDGWAEEAPFTPRLRAGVFLVASPDLLDPNFAKSVVLLVEYSDEGALGVIINRPTPYPLANLLPEAEFLSGRDDTVHIGGPVAPERIILLLKAEQPPKAAQHVVDDIYVSASALAMSEMIARGDPDEQFHAFSGHAGWAPGQLDGELAHGGWRIAEADSSLVFERDAPEVWPELIRRTTGTWVRREEPAGATAAL